VVGDVEAGQGLILNHETNQKLDPVAHDRQTGSEKPAAGVDCRSSGYALPPPAPPRLILILTLM
jgi:hypothetical protein